MQKNNQPTKTITGTWDFSASKTTNCWCSRYLEACFIFMGSVNVTAHVGHGGGSDFWLRRWVIQVDCAPHMVIRLVLCQGAAQHLDVLLGNMQANEHMWRSKCMKESLTNGHACKYIRLAPRWNDQAVYNDNTNPAIKQCPPWLRGDPADQSVSPWSKRVHPNSW